MDPVEKAADKKLKKKPEEGDSSGAPAEQGGPKGPEPTRFGDWEINGKCVDF